jgi:hypothetical protein
MAGLGPKTDSRNDCSGRDVDLATPGREQNGWFGAEGAKSGRSRA